MLGKAYKRVYKNCGWWCCRSHSGRNAGFKHSLKRIRAQEKRTWRKDQGA